MSRPLTFRVDEVEGVTRASVVSFLSSYRHFVVREIGEETGKPHYQGWLWTDVTPVTMGNRIKAQWPAVKGAARGRSSAHYSCAPIRKPSYEIYCCKGGGPTEPPDVVSIQPAIGEHIDVEANHRQWWSSKAATPAKDIHIVTEGIATFSSYDWPDDDVVEKRLVVARWMIRKMEGKGHDSYRMRSWLNGIMNRVDPTHERRFAEQLASVDRW